MLVANQPEGMLDLRPLLDSIRRGGDPDLYRGVNGLVGFPRPDWLGHTFMAIAQKIEQMYPERTHCPLGNQYDARIVCIEFCRDPRTDRTDIQRVLEASIYQKQ